MKSKITREQWEKYILDLFFGKTKNTNDALNNCINRAYRDFNRTLHGFGNITNNEKITTDTKRYLFDEFKSKKLLDIKTQEEFDAWHFQQCEELKMFYSQNNYNKFYIGQAQKWINMTFKYIFSYGNQYLNGYDELYQFCHVPLDNILLKELEVFNPPRLKTSWSRINDYKVYLSYQTWFRNNFIDLPLDVEFKLWLGESL